MTRIWATIWRWRQRNLSPHGLPRPDLVPDPVGTCLVNELHYDPDYVWKLKAVKRPWPGNRKIYHFRVYEEAEAEKRGVRVVDYFSLDRHPDLVIYQGVCDSPFFKVCIKGVHERPEGALVADTQPAELAPVFMEATIH